METLQEKAEAFSPRSRGLPVSGSSDHMKTADHKAWDKEIQKLSDVVEQKIAAMNERSRRKASSSRSATDNGTARFQQTGAKSGSYCAPRRPATVSPILNSTIASGSAIISSAPKAASPVVTATATASASSASPSGSRSVAATPSAARPASSVSSSTLPASKSSPTLVSSSSPLSSPISNSATPTTTAAPTSSPPSAALSLTAAPTSSPSSSISSPTSAVRTRISSNTTRVPTSVKSGSPTPTLTVPIASMSRPHYMPSISTSLSTIPIRSPRKEEESNKTAKRKDATGFASPPGQQAADKLDPMTQTQLSTLLVKAGTHGYEIAQMLGQADLDLVQLNSQMREMVLKIKTATDLIVDPKLHEPKGQIMDACKELLVNAREFILCCKQTEVGSKDRAQKKLPVVATLTKIFDTLRQLSNAIGK
ncbi:PDZ domain-containing protein [Balamuthia mandrillaris]